MKRLLHFTLLFIMSFQLNAQLQNGSFMHDGLEREYMVYIPDNYTPGDQWPVVFNLHGLTSNAFQQYLYTGFHLVADTANFIVCYPEGTPIVGGSGNQWNVSFPFSTNTADDVGFIDELIDTLHAHYNINLDKVYTTGMSNGGYMSYKLVCELTDRFAAMASVTGSMVPDEATACDPSMTIPVMQVHGTNDPTVPYTGSDFGIAIEDLFTQWVDHNECMNTPDTFDFPNINNDDGSTVQRIAYNDCDSDRKVHLLKVDGGEHTWPGASIIIGVTNQDIVASIEIWNFFNQYGTDIQSSNKEVNYLSDQISISPNPFTNWLNINSGTEAIQSIQISNIAGQIIYNKNQIDQNEIGIDLSDLNTGLHVVLVKTNTGTFSQKIIKH